MKLRALIIDDEAPARRRLARLLADHADVEIAGEASDGAEGLVLIERLAPDVVFLDIRMPRLSGLEMLSALPADGPHLVFTTAYDEYALEAFAANTLDYLLKPIDRDDLARAVAKLRRARSAGAATPPDLADLLRRLRREDPTITRLSVRTADGIRLVRCSEVDYFFAEDKETYFMHEGRRHAAPGPLKELAERLDGKRFLRVHRAFIVNLDRIVAVHRWFGGVLRIEMADRAEVPVSRGCLKEFKARINL